MKPCLRCKILGDLTIVLGSRWRLLFSLLATAALPVLILAQIYIPDSSGASSIELSAKLIAGAVLGTVLWARVASTVAIMGPSRLRFGPYFAHKIQPPEIGRLQARDVRDCDTGKLQGWHIFATLKRRTTGEGPKPILICSWCWRALTPRSTSFQSWKSWPPSSVVSSIDRREPGLPTYCGPFVSWRQPVIRRSRVRPVRARFFSGAT